MTASAHATSASLPGASAAEAADAHVRAAGLSVPPLPALDAVLAHARTENFTVASRLLPHGARDHLLAIYGFARLVDDVGDEGDHPPAARLAALDEVDAEIDRAFAGTATHPVFQRLTPTIRACALSPQPFRDLVEANRRDQVVTDHASMDELLDYCRLSADPVGRLVLAVVGASTPERVRRSDSVCTGLQLVEHWQDVGEDARRGRVYLPRDQRERFGVARADLLAPSASPALRALVAHLLPEVTDRLAAAGPLARSLPGRTRLAVAGFAAGGWAACDAIERADHDVLAVACRPTKARTARRLVTVLRSRAA
jgi:squalene synthase HpnC